MSDPYAWARKMLGEPETTSHLFIQPPLSDGELTVAQPQLASLYAMQSGGLGMLPPDGDHMQAMIVKMRAAAYHAGHLGPEGAGWTMMAATAQTVLEDTGVGPRGTAELQPLMAQLMTACKQSLSGDIPVLWDIFEKRNIEPAVSIVMAMEDGKNKRLGHKMVNAVRAAAQENMVMRGSALGVVLLPEMLCLQKHEAKRGPQSMRGDCQKSARQLAAGQKMKRCSECAPANFGLLSLQTSDRYLHFPHAPRADARSGPTAPSSQFQLHFPDCR